MIHLAVVPRIDTARSAGFTLIELMVAVAVVAILAALALPAYQRYAIRANASESLSLANNAKNLILECQAAGMAVADMNSGTAPFPPGTEISTDLVEGVFVVQGVIRVKYATSAPAGLSGEELVLTPAFGQGKTEWHCSFTDPNGYVFVPANCRQAP